MSDKPESNFEDRNIDQIDLAYKQSIQYGQDMVALYKQERQKREALQLTYKKLEAAFASMSDGVLVVDKTLIIQEANPAAADLFESTPQDLHGKPLANILFGAQVDDFLTRIQTTPATRFNTLLSLAEPLPRVIAFQASPLPDDGWVLVLHDKTWEERTHTMREEFLQLAAHELRTPLASIIGFTSLLQHISDQLDEQSKSVLNNVLNASERLRNTINNLINASNTNLENTEVAALDLRDIANTALSSHAQLAVEKDIRLNIDGFPVTPMLVLGNKKLLITAFGHLIENGIRHNQSAGTLSISGEETEKNYMIHFVDTGKGIAKKDLNYISQPFFQTENHATRHAVGMGLGLSIVKQIISLHGGELSIESTFGKGSTFTLTLPRFVSNDLSSARHEWLNLQNQLGIHQQKEKLVQQHQTETIISELERQLDVTQSQNLAYAKDLARLYQARKEDSASTQQAQETLNHNDRLIMMGQLAASVAHDLSNLISPILGYSQIILRRRDTIDPTLVNIIERILSISRRANALLRQMVTLSRAQSDQFERFDLNEHITEMLHILEIKIKHANIDLTTAYSENLPQILGSPIQISQVVLNLVVNAIDAMPSGGVLTVKTALAPQDKKDFISLQVSDTGQGISSEHIDHIFDAFYTTKSEDSGTGLGLSVSKQIINNHKGKILVDSVLGKGTTFTILLPTQ